MGSIFVCFARNEKNNIALFRYNDLLTKMFVVFGSLQKKLLEKKLLF